jgi:hypothetical protein
MSVLSSDGKLSHGFKATHSFARYRASRHTRKYGTNPWSFNRLLYYTQFYRISSRKLDLILKKIPLFVWQLWHVLNLYRNFLRSFVWHNQTTSKTNFYDNYESWHTIHVFFLFVCFQISLVQTGPLLTFDTTSRSVFSSYSQLSHDFKATA